MGEIPSVLLFMVILVVPHGEAEVRIVDTHVSPPFSDFGACIAARDTVVVTPVPDGLTRTITACQFVAAPHVQSVWVRPCPSAEEPDTPTDPAPVTPWGF